MWNTGTLITISTPVRVSSCADSTGWVAGFGAAFDLGGGWFGSVAYEHYGFGEIERAGWGSDSHLTATTSLDTVTVGLNYRF